MILMQGWPLLLLGLGCMFTLTGTVALTWLAASANARRWQRRAERAEETLQRLRAQRRQRRQPRPRPLLVPPGLFAEADQQLNAEANTVLLGALTTEAEAAYRALDQRKGWWR